MCGKSFFSIFCFSILLVLTGNSLADDKPIPVNKSWAERTALSVMQRSPEAWAMRDYKLMDKPQWAYTYGLVLLGFQRVYEKTGEQHYLDYAKTYVDQLIDEIWRILQQRPVQVDSIKQMILQIALCQQDPEIDLGNSGQGADRLISSLYGPTQACREDPGIAVYVERLQGMDSAALQYEATGCARAMHDTGLVSPYHAALLRYLVEHGDHLLAEALGLSSTGRDCLLSYSDLVHALINSAVHPETAQ